MIALAYFLLLSWVFTTGYMDWHGLNHELAIIVTVAFSTFNTLKAIWEIKP